MIKIQIKNFIYLVFLNLFLFNSYQKDNNDKTENYIFDQHIKPYKDFWASETAANLLPKNIWESNALFDYIKDTKGTEKLKEVKKVFSMEDKIALLKDDEFIYKFFLTSLEKQYTNKDKEIEVINDINSKIFDETRKKKQETIATLVAPEITQSEKFAREVEYMKAMDSKIDMLSRDKEAKKEAQAWKEYADAFKLDPSAENAEKLVLKYQEKYGSIESRYDLPNNILHDLKNGNPKATELVKEYAYIIQDIIRKDTAGKNQIDISLLQENSKLLEKRIADLEINMNKLKSAEEKEVPRPADESGMSKEVNTLKETIKNLETHIQKKWYKFAAITGSINACFLIFIGYIHYKKNHTNED